MSESRLHIEDLIADAVERRLRVHLDAIRSAVDEPKSPSDPAASDDEVYGIDPNRLYPVSFLCERWNVERNFIYGLEDDELPRAAWPGKELRFRGADILKLEGVETDVAPVHRIESSRVPSPASLSTKNKRRYTKNLPKLPDAVS